MFERLIGPALRTGDGGMRAKPDFKKLAEAFNTNVDGRTIFPKIVCQMSSTFTRWQIRRDRKKYKNESAAALTELEQHLVLSAGIDTSEEAKEAAEESLVGEHGGEAGNIPGAAGEHPDVRVDGHLANGSLTAPGGNQTDTNDCTRRPGFNDS